jgi:alkylation response protein AidB-like acyl-CoA dehydrogenase
MRFAYAPEHQELQTRLEAYYDGILTDAVRAQLADDPVGPAMRSVVKTMAQDGWLGLGWPVEYGGQGRGPLDQYVFFDQSNRAGAPVPVIGVNLVGPTLIEHGTEEQRRRFLPGILGGDLFFCIGYSEPEAGTDLGGLRTAAVRDGDHYIVSGQKTWTSYHSCADYCWLAVRTDPEQVGLRGLSILLMPMDSPGVSVTPLRLMNDHDIASVFLDEVRVPVENLVGAEHQGAKVITSQLNHERTTMGSPGVVRKAYEQVFRWASEERSEGRRPIDEPWVKRNLARAWSQLELLKLMNWHNVDDALAERLVVERVSATKVYATEAYIEILGLLLEVVGQAGALKRGEPGAVLAGELELMYRHHAALTFGGGANEVQRELVSAFAFGLPRSR